MLDERVVTKEEGMKCARKHNMMFIEASAKTSEGVACAYEDFSASVSSRFGINKNLFIKNQTRTVVN